MLSKGKQIFKITTTSSCFHLSKHQITFGSIWKFRWVDWQAFEVWSLRLVFMQIFCTEVGGLRLIVTKSVVHFVQLTFCTEVGGLSLMCYKILQVVLWTFWTEVGRLPLLVSLQIWTTSLKSGKPVVSSLEWISWPLSLTSKDERRPTNPETCASGRDAKMAFDNSL